jgi:hypothetical protein
MHEYCGHPPDTGTTGWKLLAQTIFMVVVIGCFLGMGIASAVEVLNLRARVEAIEEVLSQPIQIELDFKELQFPDEKFEVPSLEPRKGGVC